jgi:hypothetical protein
LLQSDLETSDVVLLPNKTINDLNESDLKQHHDQVVAVVEPDKKFRCMIDRLFVLESFCPEFARQSAEK